MEILSIHTCDCHFLAEEPLEQQFNVCSITKLQKSYAKYEFLKLWAMCFYDADCWIFLGGSGQSPSLLLPLLSFFSHGIIVVLRKAVLLLAIVFNKPNLFKTVHIHWSCNLTSTPDYGSASQKGMSYFLFCYHHLVQEYLLKKIPRDRILLILGEWVDVSIAQVSCGRKNSELKRHGPNH